MSIGKYDDLTVVSNDLSHLRVFTLTGVVANEMYFLPAFLKHYRKLGIGRFIFIDDRSVDGTREYLAKQADVMVLGSQRRFGDPVEIFDSQQGILKQDRMVHAWRSILVSRYALDDWSLHVDADEFVSLPEGLTFPDLAKELDVTGYRAVWGVMLDMYPASISDLKQTRAATEFDVGATWYFDGVQHLRLRSGKGPKLVYPGSRARLMAQYGIVKHTKRRKSITYKVFGRPLPKSNIIHKPVLLKWSQDAVFLSSHNVNLKASSRFLLPIRHYKFTGDLYRRMADAIKSGAYSGGSIEYVQIKHLLDSMEQEDFSFLVRRSLGSENFDNFVLSRNALGFS